MRNNFGHRVISARGISFFIKSIEQGLEETFFGLDIFSASVSYAS